MTSVNRRLFLQGAALAAITPVTVTSAIANSQSGRISISDAFSTEAQLTPLPFKSDKLDGISQKLIESHWKNNYGGSVRALNTIKERLDKALADDKTPAFIYNDLKREHLMRMGSVVLHEFYFGNMSPPQERNPQLDKALTAAFGSVKNWEKEFRLIGAGLGGGSGWVMLAWNTHTQTLENYWMADHMHAPASSQPILVMDMYEHSYHMDYGAAATQYVDAFFKNINWKVVASRLDKALTTKW